MGAHDGERLRDGVKGEVVDRPLHDLIAVGCTTEKVPVHALNRARGTHQPDRLLEGLGSTTRLPIVEGEQVAGDRVAQEGDVLTTRTPAGRRAANEGHRRGRVRSRPHGSRHEVVRSPVEVARVGIE